jgi:alcohol dehydrogenase YqhD (iron-dependent ADH family)
MHCIELMLSGSDKILGFELSAAVARSLINCRDILETDNSDYEARNSFCWASILAMGGVCNFDMNGGDFTIHCIDLAIR